ncbi:hypothetical protein [Luteolibacter soli]|uniref:Uncharacterized protein n=1 Tax=Luteolibacter soli TaxID=3135280 RepID=A0ABU9AQR6_9BACT
MKLLAFICLIAAVRAQEKSKPAPPTESHAQEATREEAQQRLGELMAYATTTEAQGAATRRERFEAEEARSNRALARDKEMRSLAEKREAGDKAAAERISALWKESAADAEAWQQFKDKQSAISEKLEPWSREFELAAGSILKGKGVLDSGAGLTSIKAGLQSGSLDYRWQGSAEGGKPELEVRFGFRPMPGIAAHFGNPTRKIGTTGTVIIEREHIAAVAFEKFYLEVELDHWKEGDKPPLEVAAQAIDFDALGSLKVAMAGAEPAKLDHTLPRLPLEIKRPPASATPREEQLKALGNFFKEALDLKKKISEIETEEREERNRLSLRLDETGATALSDEIDRLRRKARAGEAGTEKAIAEAKAKWRAIVEKENAPLRAIEEKKTALLHEAELKNPRFASVAPSILAPGASIPDNVGLSKIDADLGKGTVWLHWDTQPGSTLPAVTVLLQLFHRPDRFEEGNPVKGMLDNHWPIIIDAPNNARIWLQELQVDVSVSPEWQVREIRPKDLAASLLDFKAIADLDAAAASKP